MVSRHETNYSTQARESLVKHLLQKGSIQSEFVSQAFLAVPREVFVPQFFEQEGFKWVIRTSEQYEPERWIDAIYRDEPLITWIDAQNRPGSSSSAPTVMAMMLEALVPQPGNHILEIGTGSGFNAALLAHIVGDSRLITTIEVEKTLAQLARKALEMTVGPVAVYVGNGYDGYSPRAPYERIIVTASSSIIPRTWYEQLAANGRIVMDLQGSLHKSGFLVVEKMADGSAYGQFDTRYLYFMPMRSGNAATSPVKRLLQQTATQQITLSDDETTRLLFGNVAFHWFLQWAVSGITMTKAKMKGKDKGQNIPLVTFVDPEEETVIQLALRDGVWSGYERGSGGLWEAIMRTYHEWNDGGRPDQTAYHVAWDQQDACFQLICGQGTARRTFLLSRNV